MRIITAQEFMKEPYGTVYIHYKPHIFIGQPCIKTEPRSENGESWYATDILPWTIEDKFNMAEESNGCEIETEGFCTDDATYNNDDDILYAVFSKEEVRGE